VCLSTWDDVCVVEFVCAALKDVCVGLNTICGDDHSTDNMAYYRNADDHHLVCLRPITHGNRLISSTELFKCDLILKGVI